MNIKRVLFFSLFIFCSHIKNFGAIASIYSFVFKPIDEQIKYLENIEKKKREELNKIMEKIFEPLTKREGKEIPFIEFCDNFTKLSQNLTEIKHIEYISFLIPTAIKRIKEEINKEEINKKEINKKEINKSI
jgi:hypothetical protein